MDTKSVKKFKWFWAWQDEKEQAWLRKMAQQGLYLDSISLPGLYHFQQGDPGDFVYRLDFQTLKAKDRDSYLQLFEDAGWEHVADLGGWIYFRHQVQGAEIPEIYSDQESKIGKYQRLLAYLIIFLPIMIILLPDSARAVRYGPFSLILQFLGLVLLLLFVYAIIRIFHRINQLKKTRNSG